MDFKSHRDTKECKASFLSALKTLHLINSYLVCLDYNFSGMTKKA